MKKAIVMSVLMLAVCLGGKAQTKWVGTWATAVERPFSEGDMPKTALDGNSLRQVIHVSLGGKKLRLRLSNEMSTQPVEIRSVYIADAGDGTDIDAGTAAYLTFDGKKSVTIEDGEAVYTDAVTYNLKPLQLLTVTINYGKTPEKVISPGFSITPSYPESPSPYSVSSDGILYVSQFSIAMISISRR